MEFLENIPQPLYKYRVWHDPLNPEQFSRRILTHSEVYFASSDQFNDPFDGSLPFRYRKSDMTPENIFKKLYEQGKKENPNISDQQLIQDCYERQSSGIFENGEYWKRYHPIFKKQINEKFGILSLASKNDNLLMWSHYADSHKGFCVGLDKYYLFKHCYAQLGPVTYDDSFPEIPLFDNSPWALVVLTTTKSKCWSYEEEYRFVKIEGARKAVTVPNEAILEIILGCNMKEDHKKVIYELAAVKFPKAKLFETQINNEEFKLDFIPIIR